MYTLHDNTCGEFKDNEMEIVQYCSHESESGSSVVLVLYLDFWIQKYF